MLIVGIVDKAVRSCVALCYLASRKFADDGTDLEEQFSSLQIGAIPCKYVLGSFCVWKQIGLQALTHEQGSLHTCLVGALAAIARPILMASEGASRDVCALVQGLCCAGVNRPEVADKILEILGTDPSQLDPSHPDSSGTDWCTELHKALGQAYARVERFSDARRHFLAAAKPLLLAPVASFSSDSGGPNVLQEVSEMTDSLEQDPASALELASLAVRIEAYVESATQAETGWKARLLSKTFGYALKINDIESAYHAMASNPDPEKRNNSLRMLIHALHKNKQLEILFDKPLVAAPARSLGSSMGVCLHGEVARILLERARAGGDEYFKSLYAFHVKQQNMQKAAEAMHALSERCALSGIKTDNPDDYLRAADYLMVAINALQLCPESARWIERQHNSSAFADTDLGADHGSKRKLGRTGFQDANASSLFNDSRLFADSAATNMAVDSPSERRASMDTGLPFAAPLHISALEGEYALLKARCVTQSVFTVVWF